MCKKTIMYCVVVTFLAGAGLCYGQTWRLSSKEQWVDVKNERGSEYLLAVADIKQLVSTGQFKNAQKGFAELKANFSQIAGADFDDFTKGELLFAQRKFAKAARRYDKFMDKYPGSPLYESVLQRQFMIAQGYLFGQKRRMFKVLKLHAYDEGAAMMEKIADRTGDAPIAQRAITTVAKSSEKRGAFAEAYEAWSDISSRWPTGKTGRDSLLGMARSMHNAYRGPLYDVSVVENAKSYYDGFVEKYPEQVKQLSIEQTLKIVNEQLAVKKLTIGKYYEKTSKQASAKLYYNKVIADWPSSAAANEARSRLKNIAAKPAPSQDGEKKSWLQRIID